uniref:Uncharacterized protein n=1 Tax=Amphimedon queenslandica TaxID=400682 RepID=A0A1X7V622_AMPQE
MSKRHQSSLMQFMGKRPQTKVPKLADSSTFSTATTSTSSTAAGRSILITVLTSYYAFSFVLADQPIPLLPSPSLSGCSVQPVQEPSDLSQSSSSKSQLILANSVIHSPLSTPVTHTPPCDIAQNKGDSPRQPTGIRFPSRAYVSTNAAFKLVGMMSMSGWRIPLKEMLPFVSRAVTLE